MTKGPQPTMRIPVQIEKVLELTGAIRPYPKSPASVYAHISKPVQDKFKQVQYAMMALLPQHGVMHLGNINPETMMFEHFDPDLRTPAMYKLADNQVVEQVSVHLNQMEPLKTLEEVLRIPGISIKRELIPESQTKIPIGAEANNAKVEKLIKEYTLKGMDTFVFEWEGLRVPKTVTFPGNIEKEVGYMRDGLFTFKNGSNAVYERLDDIYPEQPQSVFVAYKFENLREKPAAIPQITTTPPIETEPQKEQKSSKRNYFIRAGAALGIVAASAILITSAIMFYKYHTGKKGIDQTVPVATTQQAEEVITEPEIKFTQQEFLTSANKQGLTGIYDLTSEGTESQGNIYRKGGPIDLLAQKAGIDLFDESKEPARFEKNGINDMMTVKQANAIYNAATSR